MRHFVAALLASAGLSFGLVSQPAFAEDLSACGNLEIGANAQCTVVPPSLDCEAQCTPISVQASCAAELYASCDGQCSGQLSVDCTASCNASCTGQCNVDPGTFDCSAQCQASCSGNCDAECAAKPGNAHCAASCKASCSGHCDAQCNVVPPSADCNARCNASCSGSCQAKADLSCEIDCQASGFVSCEASVTGGCKAACTSEKGALFCDGQFVNTQNVDTCVAALKSLLNINVVGAASGSAGCDAGTCEVGGDASASCSVSPAAQGSSFALLGLLALSGLVAVRRRRR